MMPFCNPTKINLFDNPAAIKSKTFFEKKWNICFDENVSNAFFAKICSALTENMNRDLHSVHWEKVTKVPFMFMTEFPLKKWPKFRSWTWTERELNGKSSVPTMLCLLLIYVLEQTVECFHTLQQASNVDILSTIGVLHQIARLVAKVNK